MKTKIDSIGKKKVYSRVATKNSRNPVCSFGYGPYGQMSR